MTESEWEPITEEEFIELFNDQYNDLDDEEKERFNRHRVEFWKAIIRRSDMYGDESVYVVYQYKDVVLYFDDVEYGFNFSDVDEEGRILNRGGDQCTLRDALNKWFPEGRF